MPKFLLIGPDFADSVSPYAKAFSDAGMDVQVEACDAEWGRALELLRAEGCMGGVVCEALAAEALTSVDIAAASARIAGGVTLVACKAGKLLGLNTVGAGVAAAIESMDVELKGAQVSIIGTGCAARSCVLSLSQSGAGAVAMLGEDKEATQETMQGYLERMERAAYATIMLGDAEDGKRNLLEAYEEVDFKFGSVEGSAGTMAESALIVDAADPSLAFEAGESVVVSINSDLCRARRIVSDIEAISAIFVY